MASSQPAPTPIHIAHTLSSYQLLELPSELTSLIESGSVSTLYLKSTVPRASKEDSSTAVLCTERQTFSVRQAQSSNCLYVLSPTTSTSTSAANGSHSSGLVAVSQCQSVLELSFLNPDAEAYLVRILPVYYGLDSPPPLEATALASKAALLSDAPFSEAEFEKACAELCVLDLNGSAHRPLETALLSLWRSLVTASDVAGVRLEHGFQLEMVRGLVVEEGHDGGLLEMVLRRVGAIGAEGHEQVMIERDRCVAWLGRMILLGAGSEGIVENDFLELWKAEVPDRWKESATLPEGLDQKDFVRQGERIAFADQTRFGKTMPAKEAEKQGQKSKNKWHERFAK